MANIAPLNNVDHSSLRVITQRGAQFGDAVKSALTFTFEFRSVQAQYPILFQKDQSGQFQPVVLFGFEKGENLFLKGDKWDATYIPVMMRRDPFLIGQNKNNPENAVLSIDLDSPRVSESEGEALFQPMGGQTDFLQASVQLLNDMHHGMAQNKVFVDAMMAHGLIEDVTMDIKLKDGSENHLFGYSALNEEKIKDLKGDVLADFGEKGVLMPMFMMLASIVQMQQLVNRKSDTLA